MKLLEITDEPLVIQLIKRRQMAGDVVRFVGAAGVPRRFRRTFASGKLGGPGEPGRRGWQIEWCKLDGDDWHWTWRDDAQIEASTLVKDPDHPNTWLWTPGSMTRDGEANEDT